MRLWQACQLPNSAEVLFTGVGNSSGSSSIEGSKECRKNTDVICKTCGASVENLQEHILAHKDVPENMCAGCGKSLKYIKKHREICRGQPNCKPCGILFETHAEYTKHIGAGKNSCPNSANAQLRFPCELCELVFFQESRLKRHMVVHSGEKNHCCDVCGKGFKRKDYVNRHKRTYPDGSCVEMLEKKNVKVVDAKKLKKTKLLEVVVKPCMWWMPVVYSFRKPDECPHSEREIRERGSIGNRD